MEKNLKSNIQTMLSPLKEIQNVLNSLKEISIISEKSKKAESVKKI